MLRPEAPHTADSHRCLAKGTQASIFGLTLGKSQLYIDTNGPPIHRHTYCTTCKRHSLPCSWGYGTASPSYVSPWPAGLQSGGCRRHKRSMHARRARCESCVSVPVSAHGCPGLKGGGPGGPGVEFNVRVKVVLFVVHPACPHYRSKVQLPACFDNRGARRKGSVRGSSSAMFS